MQLTWAQNVVEKTSGRVLVLTPLAVGSQTVREAQKFGLQAEQSRDGTFSGRIVVANYEKLHLFNAADFAGVVCDESSILKNFEGITRKAITEFMRTRPYRLLCTATAAPNDYLELGTSSEALGSLGAQDMVNMFFRKVQQTTTASEERRSGIYMLRAHAQIVDDSTLTDVAGADYLLMFRRAGENPVPVSHPTWLHEYAGEREMPEELKKYKGWTGKQTENRFSHWIWRQYASSFWDDIRLDNVLPYKESRDPEDEKHVHPLQLDVIERAVVLWSNPGEIVLTPFMGVGSEVYGAVKLGRKGVGVELKESYYRQAVKNVAHALASRPQHQDLFGG
jgi:hypothetical protein